jgi:hypothetical protein
MPCTGLKVAGDKFPLFFDVDGLEEGLEYNFRVKAVNDEGESEPLEGDKPFIAKNPFGKSIVERVTYTVSYQAGSGNEGQAMFICYPWISVYISFFNVVKCTADCLIQFVF